MNRREFLAASTAFAAASRWSGLAQTTGTYQGFPPAYLRNTPFIETTPVPEYKWAPASSYEAFRDTKFGARIHWGIYSIWHRGAESWPFLGIQQSLSNVESGGLRRGCMDEHLQRKWHADVCLHQQAS